MGKGAHPGENARIVADHVEYDASEPTECESVESHNCGIFQQKLTVEIDQE